MTTVNVHEAKTNLSRLLALVEAGEEVEIARRGKVIAKLVKSERRVPRLGMGGPIVLKEGWDDPMTEEELAEWYGPIGGLDEP